MFMFVHIVVVLGRLYEVKDEAHAQAFKNKVSLKAERSRPLEERLAASRGVESKGRRDSFFLEEGASVRGHGGSRQVSFIPRGGSGGSSARGRGGRGGGGPGEAKDGSRDFKKRSIQSLGLKSDGGGRGGRGGRRGGGRGFFRGRGRGRGRT